MKKILISATLAVAALASCQKNEIVEQKQNAIDFNVVTENQTKAADVYCMNHIMEDFKLSALFTERENESARYWYFQNDYIRYNRKWTNETAIRYWPTNGYLTFYGIKNGDLTFGNPDTEPTVNYTVDTDVAKQNDLVFAKTTIRTREADDLKCYLRFCHALSQIEFRAKSEIKDYTVEVTGVKVINAPKTGTFTYPANDTYVAPHIDGESGSYIDHTQSGVNTDYNDRGTWTNLDEVTDYEVTFDPITLPMDGSVKNLTVSVTEDDENADFTKSLLLIPTIGTAKADISSSYSWNEYKGTHLAIKCRIYADTSSGEGIEFKNGWVDCREFSLDAWKAGKKYIYTFAFQESPSDYDGVLSPLKYYITVDDFEDGFYDSDGDRRDIVDVEGHLTD